MKKFLKPKQGEILDEIIKRQTERIFMDMCKENLICPECGGQLITDNDRYYCTDCDNVIF